MTKREKLFSNEAKHLVHISKARLTGVQEKTDCIQIQTTYNYHSFMYFCQSLPSVPITMTVAALFGQMAQYQSFSLTGVLVKSPVNASGLTNILNTVKT